MQGVKEKTNTSLPGVGRRRFLGWLAMVGGGIAMSAQNLSAGLFYSTRSVEGIPQAWVDQKGLDVLRYANYIKRLGLKNVTPHMVIAPHFKTRGRAHNDLPPQYMWRNIAATLAVVDKLCTRMGTGVGELLSIYRSPGYNRAVRGRSRSQHLENRAVDVTFRGVSSWTVSQLARKMRAEGHYRGGVGHYSSFTHIDTRGVNTDW